MTNRAYPIDSAREWLTDLLPDQAQRIEEASDAGIKASIDSAYAGGWIAFLSGHNSAPAA